MQMQTFPLLNVPLKPYLTPIVPNNSKPFVNVANTPQQVDVFTPQYPVKLLRNGSSSENGSGLLVGLLGLGIFGVLWMIDVNSRNEKLKQLKGFLAEYEEVVRLDERDKIRKEEEKKIPVCRCIEKESAKTAKKL